MKAWQLQRPAPVEDRPLLCTDIPIPQPSEREVLIKVDACGVCRTDLHVVEGELANRLLPVTPGHQVVGRIVKAGDGVSEGQRVGIAWLHSTCRECRFCVSGRENLCEKAEFTGWTRNGGFAEYVTAASDYVYPIPEGFGDVEAAPLLCAGIIGYRCLRLTGVSDWSGARIGIYGFGAAGHISIQIARFRGADVYVATRDRKKHQPLAEELGAVWVGDTVAEPPVLLDAAIIYAPAGEIVPAALKALDKGGSLVLGGIHMSPIPAFEYKLLYGERLIRSVANNTRQDGVEFLNEASQIPVKTSVETFRGDQLGDALIALKHDSIKGAAVWLP
jgi:propanol-preferring alcohol dehydrogenase